jgi:hypothetical protein
MEEDVAPETKICLLEDVKVEAMPFGAEVDKWEEGVIQNPRYEEAESIIGI